MSVGIDHDTAAFAVNAIKAGGRRWAARDTRRKTLLITADGGGSNGSRVRLWKVELQKLADELGLSITVCHLPPGTSKWNKIEHRLFSFITSNWRGRPLVSHQVIVQLIGATTTKTGLEFRCELDDNLSLRPNGSGGRQRRSAAAAAAANIEYCSFLRRPRLAMAAKCP